MAWKFFDSPLSQKPSGVHKNSYTMWMLINALCKPSSGAPGSVTKMLHTKKGQKLDNFEPVYLGKYRFWRKMISDFWTHYQPPFFWLCLFTPTWMLLFFFFFFLLFFFFFSGYLFLNSLTHCIQSLSNWRYQGGLVCGWNWGARLGVSPSIGSSRILKF